MHDSSHLNHWTKEDRQLKAAGLSDFRSYRSPEEQLAELDHRLGKGIGARRERARLTAQLKRASQKDFVLV